MRETGLVVSYLLDGKGGGQELGWEEISAWRAEDGLLWVHLERNASDSQEWLEHQSGLDPLVVEAMLAESTRPRCAQMKGGVMLFLRGVNLNPGADPEDMVSIRLWLEDTRIISVRMRRLLSVDDLRSSLDSGHGPTDVGDFVVQLADQLASRMAGVISDIDDEVDRLQDMVLEEESRKLRAEPGRRPAPAPDPLRGEVSGEQHRDDLCASHGG